MSGTGSKVRFRFGTFIKPIVEILSVASDEIGHNAGSPLPQVSYLVTCLLLDQTEENTFLKIRVNDIIKFYSYEETCF